MTLGSPNLYLSEKGDEEKLLECIQSANSLKAWGVAKKRNGTAIIVNVKGMQSKRLIVNGQQYLKFSFFWASCIVS